MSLARVKVWNPGDVLTASDLNAEFNNVLNNPVSLVSPSTGPINFNLQAHTNLVPTAITATSGSVGQVLSISTAGTLAYQTPITVSRVSNLRGSLSSQSGTFAADSYIMRTTAGSMSWTISATSSYSASVGIAGPTAGGRDQAGSFASTFIHWYAISTGATSTAPAGLVSTNPPTVGPAMPTSYSGLTYLGASPYSSASTTVTSTHLFRGRYAVFPAPLAILSGGNSTTLTAITFSNVVPPNVPVMHLKLSNASTATGVSFSIDSGSTFMFFTAGNAAAKYDVDTYTPVTSDGISYQANANTASFSVGLLGYVMPNGDV